MFLKYGAQPRCVHDEHSRNGAGNGVVGPVLAVALEILVVAKRLTFHTLRCDYVPPRSTFPLALVLEYAAAVGGSCIK
jgi:hypothetical protein